MTSEKKCTSCGILKELANFYLTNTKEERASKCKDCISTSYVARYVNDPAAKEIKRLYNNTYYSKNSKTIQKQRKDIRESDLDYKLRHVFRNSRQRSKNCNDEFNITVDYVRELYTKQQGICALSGEQMQITGDRYLSNMMSLDRIDSSKGYIIGNVQWVGIRYNLMKSKQTQQDFLTMCTNVVKTLS